MDLSNYTLAAAGEGPTLTKGISEALWTPLSGNVAGTGTVGVRAVETVTKGLTLTESYELVIAVHACVEAIAAAVSKARPRLFTREGEEIVGGPLWDLLRMPAKGCSTRKLIHDIVTWKLIAGEYDILVKFLGGAYPEALIPLDPQRLSVWKPKEYKTREDIATWRYIWQDAKTEDIRDAYLMHDALFNPRDTVRGLSPLITGSVVAGTDYAISRYNRTYFENGGIPSHIVNLPENVSRREREDFERRYQAEFGHRSNGAHKALVVSGGEVKIHTLDQPFQEGAFLGLKAHTVEQIAMLYRVPPIEANILSKTRFDSAPEERKLFVESCLVPQLDALSECFQQQLVDPWFSLSPVKTAGGNTLKKAMDRRFEEARGDRPDSQIVILFDADSLPIMGDVNLARIKASKELGDSLFLSPKEKIDFLGLEFDDRPERDDVYALTTYQNVTHPEKNLAIMSAEAKAKTAGDDKPAADEPAKPKTATKAEKALVHKLRTLSVKSGELFGLAEADALHDGGCARLVRVVRHGLRKAMEGAGDEDARRDAAKAFFAEFDPKEALA
jgi:HK97 family phage portal protein